MSVSACSHDFIGEFTTSYRELARGQSQFNVYEVSGTTPLVRFWPSGSKAAVPDVKYEPMPV